MFACNEHAHHTLRVEHLRKPSSVVVCGECSTCTRRAIAWEIFRMQSPGETSGVVITPASLADTYYSPVRSCLCAETAQDVHRALADFREVAKDTLVLVDPACGAPPWPHKWPRVVQCVTTPVSVPHAEFYALAVHSKFAGHVAFGRLIRSHTAHQELDHTLQRLAALPSPNTAYVWDALWRWSFALQPRRL